MTKAKIVTQEMTNWETDEQLFRQQMHHFKSIANGMQQSAVQYAEEAAQIDPNNSNSAVDRMQQAKLKTNLLKQARKLTSDSRAMVEQMDLKLTELYSSPDKLPPGGRRVKCNVSRSGKVSARLAAKC